MQVERSKRVSLPTPPFLQTRDDGGVSDKKVRANVEGEETTQALAVGVRAAVPVPVPKKPRSLAFEARARVCHLAF